MKNIALCIATCLVFILNGCASSKNDKKPELDTTQITAVKKKLTIQESIINKIKLPKRIDDITVIMKMYNDNNKLTYVYDLDLPKLIASQPSIYNKISYTNLTNYCQNSFEANFIKKFFTNGVRHIYFIKQEKVLDITLTPDFCE